MGTEAVL
jgi:hypothetical protein